MLHQRRVEGSASTAGGPGLYHVASCVGASGEELAAARRGAERHGLTPFGEMDGATPCFRVKDPDCHEVELYVDPAAARRG